MNATDNRGMARILISCCIVGAVIVAATIARGRVTGPEGSPAPRTAATEEYGKRLLMETSLLLGPDAPNPELAA